MHRLDRILFSKTADAAKCDQSDSKKVTGLEYQMGPDGIIDDMPDEFRGWAIDVSDSGDVAHYRVREKLGGDSSD